MNGSVPFYFESNDTIKFVSYERTVCKSAVTEVLDFSGACLVICCRSILLFIIVLEDVEVATKVCNNGISAIC